MSNFVIAQIFGVIGIICSILSMQMKKRKHILILLLMLNLASALNFLFLKGYTSSIICFVAVLEMLINYFFFEKKKKDVPLYLIFIYIIINIILGIIPYTNIIDILPIICATLYCVTIICKKESNIRKLMFLNQVFWLTVDLKYKAYMFAISNILTLISIIISMYRYDYKKGKK